MTEYKDPKVELVSEMMDFMLKNKGIGLAASQIGKPDKVFVIHPELAQRYKVPLVYTNPTITGRSEYTITEDEGCLSHLNENGEFIRVPMARAYRVNLKCDEGEFLGRALLARVFQHEVDHLEGKEII